MRRFKGVRAGKANNIEIRWQVNGKRRSVILDIAPTEKNQANAARQRARFIELDRRGEYEQKPDAANPTFKEVCLNYVADASKELAYSTIYNYCGMLDRYWSGLDDMPIRDIKLSHIRAEDRKVDWNTQTTRGKAHSALQQVFKHAFNDDIIENDPSAKLSTGKSQKPEVDAFGVSEKELILGALKGKFYVFYLLMFENGFRTGELLASKLSDIDFKAGTFTVERGIFQGRIKNSTKTHQLRKVLLSDRSIEALNAYRKDLLSDKHAFKNKQRWLFPTTNGRPYSTHTRMTSNFKQACTDTGVRYRRPYYARHSYATHALTGKLDPRFVAKQMGDLLETVQRNYVGWISSENDDKEMMKFNNRER